MYALVNPANIIIDANIKMDKRFFLTFEFNSGEISWLSVKAKVYQKRIKIELGASK